MKYYFSILPFFFILNAFAAEDLLSEEKILDYGELDEKRCEPIQEFKQIGPKERGFFSHTIVEQYRYDSGCLRTSGNAILYKSSEGGFRKVWEKGMTAPAPFVYLDIYKQNEHIVLIYDLRDGGNANFSYQEAYVIEDDLQIRSIDEAPLFKWTYSQLLEDQNIHYLAEVNYSSSPIKYEARISKKQDHYRNPTGGWLYIEAIITKNGSLYSLEIINSYNIGKANYRNDQGLREYKDGNHSNAISLFRKSVAAYPDHWQAHSNLGLSLYKNGLFVKSIESSNVVLNADGPSDKAKANASFNIGLAYEKMEDLSEALKFYKLANTLSPSRSRAKTIKDTEIKISDGEMEKG